MSEVQVNIWKHMLGNFYAEISNGFYAGTLCLINIDPETRTVTHISVHGSSSWAGKEFFDDCTFVTKTTVDYREKDEYPWHRTDNAAGLAIQKLYGNPAIIIKKIRRNPDEKPYPLGGMRDLY